MGVMASSTSSPPRSQSGIPACAATRAENLFRMRQFFEAYRGQKKVSALLTQLPWTHHLIILGQTEHLEEREFYLLTAIKERWSSRGLERQIASGALLRTDARQKKVSAALAQTQPAAIDELKNAYNLEFLSLPDGHSEGDLQGPQEREEAFRWRINKKVRESSAEQYKSKSFKWDIGPDRRTQGTVQSDRWTGKASLLAGSKLIAVMPVGGWWDQYVATRTKELPFSLIVSVRTTGLDVYSLVEIGLTPPIEVPA